MTTMPSLPLARRVVGVGASAGGFDALKRLVSHIPVDTGLAFVVLQHLAPTQSDLLANLLGATTTLRVVDAATHPKIEPNTIFVVPPHTAACVENDTLVLDTAESPHRPPQPIDELFRSIATALRERAVGVVLSGTAHDGTEGLRAIQAAGGLTFAQLPSEAQYDEMPRSAIDAGVVEVVLDAGAIGEELGAIARLGPRTPVSPTDEAPAMQRVLEQLREACGIDFTSYKRSTIERRLARRLARVHVGSLDEYSGFLATHPNEARMLYEDLLVHATEFFRDRPVLEKATALVAAEVVRTKPTGAVRVWVPGCSTGEEVYSLAMLFVEALGEGRHIELFGSDLSEGAVATARQGRYPAAAVAKLEPGRLTRFFEHDRGGYRVARHLRDRCVFARHDLVTDPPFSKLDLVSCRNVLIYLGAPLQERVIPIFHYALDAGGHLLLGRAETIGSFDTLFAPVDADARIYKRQPGGRTPLLFPLAAELGRLGWKRPVETTRSARDVQREADHLMLARYAPPSVIVDGHLDIVQFRGHTGLYLEQPPGQPQLNLLRMAREGLAAVLPLVIQQARQRGTAVRRDGVVVADGHGEHRFALEVVPLRDVDATNYLLVIFDPPPVSTSAANRIASAEPLGEDDARRVREDLVATKEYLSSMVAQHVATTEELGMANEELQSTNEELQSTNEELQTAKEELQSANEELESTNEALHRGNALLHDANDDLMNVLASVDIAIIIVDAERRVRRFTPKARAVMNLIPSDAGRPISDLRSTIAVRDLDAAIGKVIETLVMHEVEAEDGEGRSYRMQIRPYRTTENKIGGAVIAFVDISALRAARDLAAAIVDAAPSPLVVVDDRLRVTSANRAFHVAFGTGGALAGRELFELGEWRTPTLRARLDAAFATGEPFDDLEVDHVGAAGQRVLQLAGRRVSIGDPPVLVLGIADLTERRRIEAAREASKREQDAFLDAVSHELRTPLSAVMLWAEALRTLEHDDPRRLEAIATIIDSARAEAQLVDDLLDIAMSRSSEMSVKMESVDPVAVVRSVTDAARPAAAAKQVTLETALHGGPRMLVDPRRLRQIAAGLVTNAIKFTPAGGTVAVSLSLHDGTMELIVRDNGRGIDADMLGRVFEPFSQADRSSTRTHPGMGIGLTLVRHLVTRHGGVIEVASPGADRGSVFTVRLPTGTA